MTFYRNNFLVTTQTFSKRSSTVQVNRIAKIVLVLLLGTFHAAFEYFISQTKVASQRTERRTYTTLRTQGQTAVRSSFIKISKPSSLNLMSRSNAFNSIPNVRIPKNVINPGRSRFCDQNFAEFSFGGTVRPWPLAIYQLGNGASLPQIKKIGELESKMAQVWEIFAA
jgi:hypothetical protein